jgi:UDP-N-acetylmuramyl pentapeptide phosphotransferase/UDP-N-acetylglucosamine-1-phosphate transferase
MGDAGSIPLGFLAGALGVQGALAGAWPAWFPLLVFSPFIVDATVTLARRIVRREPFWRAHRSHYYQRLVLAGWSHRRMALAGYALMCAGAAAALAGTDAGFLLQCGIIGVWAAVWVSLLLAIERHLRRVGNAVTRAPGRSIG